MSRSSMKTATNTITTVSSERKARLRMYRDKEIPPIRIIVWKARRQQMQTARRRVNGLSYFAFSASARSISY